MRQRGVDRRSDPRFEILGTLLGSVETWHPLKVRNLGRCGALVETAEPFPRDWKVTARVTFHGRRREMRVDVRHATRVSPRDGGYVAGLEFTDPLFEMTEVASEHSTPENAAAANSGERRRFPRTDAPSAVEIEFARWTTVVLADVSMSGAMFVGSARMDLGGRAHFRVRFGERSFEAEIESRRIVAQTGPNPRYGVGASFVSMDEASRQSLASFLVAAEN